MVIDFTLLNTNRPLNFTWYVLVHVYLYRLKKPIPSAGQRLPGKPPAPRGDLHIPDATGDKDAAAEGGSIPQS